MIRPPIMKKSRLGNSIDEGIQVVIIPIVIFLLFYVFINSKLHTLVAPFFHAVMLAIFVSSFRNSAINKGKHCAVRVLIAMKYYMRKAVNKWHGI